MNLTHYATQLIRIGALLVAASLALFAVIFFPVLREEVRYRFFTTSPPDQKITFSQEALQDPGIIVPADEEFSVIVPKIGANAPVVANVDPFNEGEYRRKLLDGVAHAQGSTLPGQIGNTFLFAHSSDSFYRASRYNTVFYLLNKLELGDRFYVVHKKRIHAYVVRATRLVAPEDVAYLGAVSDQSTVTLMTCWPPGTDAKRFLVFGALEKSSDIGEMEISQ